MEGVVIYRFSKCLGIDFIAQHYSSTWKAGSSFLERLSDGCFVLSSLYTHSMLILNLNLPFSVSCLLPIFANYYRVLSLNYGIYYSETSGRWWESCIPHILWAWEEALALTWDSHVSLISFLLGKLFPSFSDRIEYVPLTKFLSYLSYRATSEHTISLAASLPPCSWSILGASVHCVLLESRLFVWSIKVVLYNIQTLSPYLSFF